VFLVYRAHQSSGRWQNLVNEDEDGLLWRELDALSNHIDELANGEVCRDKILLLVDRCYVRLLDLFADDLTDAHQQLQMSADQRTVLTGMRSAYFCRMRSASAFRFSKGCSSLNLERMMDES
jgi:hypothetical protein